MNTPIERREPKLSYEKLASLFSPSAREMPSIARIKACLMPVMHSADELERFIGEHRDYLIVPYLLYKEKEEDALLSTSSMHMNWLWPNLLYVPVNIKNGEHDALRQVYQSACSQDNVIFFNHTIPHKSNPVLQSLFGERSGDYLMRGPDGFAIADGNGQAFVQMTRQLARGTIDFAKVTVVIVGVGGAGRLAAEAISQEHPGQLILVDVLDKSQLAQALGAAFYQGIDQVPDLSGEQLVIIDATAHFEDGIQRCVALDLVEKYDSAGNIFIDYNMNTEIGAYHTLMSSTGVGREYVAITNYVMVLNIIKAAKEAGHELPFISRELFDQKVLQSVKMRDKIKGVLSKGK